LVLAVIYQSAGERDLALAFSRKATAAVLAHAATGDVGSEKAGGAGGLIMQRAGYFVNHVANLAAAGRAGLEPMPALGGEAFEIGQWAEQSSAGAAVQQMALRFSSGDSAVAKLVREHQDLAATWRSQDKTLVAALSKPEAQQKSAETERLRKEIAETEAKLAANAARLEKDFPDYAALANPKPLKVEETQKLLRPEEALVFIPPGDKESYIFALTREAFDWQTIPLGRQVLADKVTAFRRGLAADFPAPAETDPADCRGLAPDSAACRGLGPAAQGFDLASAQELYAALLGPVESLVQDKKHLMIVPSGPLTSLPFHLLVTEKPASLARLGQQGTLTRLWAKRGSRPRSPRDLRHEWAYIFGAVCPARGATAALVLPHANSEAFSLHLAEISKEVAAGAHAMLTLDGAGIPCRGGSEDAGQHHAFALAVRFARTPSDGKRLGIPAKGGWYKIATDDLPIARSCR
jgi:hypothetical protein